MSEGTDNITRLWQRCEESLNERLCFYVRNVALLRISLEDAAAYRKRGGLEKNSGR